MDPKYTGEMLRHLDKENELLTVAYKSMSDELHKLQVEEEMLMRKFYEFMSAQGPSKKVPSDDLSVCILVLKSLLCMIW
ncbi:OLC1v1012948C3 [Oldenlandia corymbosa var. corymbosa]|uniref:OLC1v1012948C3 n=1 Tax=Oldenlandia corymbosa var. corymbosa TaxID=529605 RepID=A0AAV1DX22_OLDCO|nr:OLC1v1012948C3 [Oldenlandia corymbosa var. corymbosa]